MRYFDEKSFRRLNGKEFYEISYVPVEDKFLLLDGWYGSGYISKKNEDLMDWFEKLPYDQRNVYKSIKEGLVINRSMRRKIKDKYAGVFFKIMLGILIEYFLTGRIIFYEFNRGKEYNNARNTIHKDISDNYDVSVIGTIYLYYLMDEDKFLVCDGHNRLLVSIHRYLEGYMTLEELEYEINVDIFEFIDIDSFVERHMKLNNANKHSNLSYIRDPNTAIGSWMYQVKKEMENTDYFSCYLKDFDNNFAHILVNVRKYGIGEIYNTPRDLMVVSKNLNCFAISKNRVDALSVYEVNLFVDAFLYYGIYIRVLDLFSQVAGNRDSYQKIRKSTYLFSLCIRDRFTKSSDRVFCDNPVLAAVRTFASIGSFSGIANLSNKNGKSQDQISLIKSCLINRTRIKPDGQKFMETIDKSILSLSEKIEKEFSNVR